MQLSLAGSRPSSGQATIFFLSPLARSTQYSLSKLGESQEPEKSCSIDIKWPISWRSVNSYIGARSSR